MSEPERWIVIPNWPELQHYKKRDPAWVKLYTRLLHKDEYAKLTYRQRGILHSLWMLYAASDGLVNGSHPARLGRLLGSVPVRARDIEALNHAGYITLSDSRPLALRYQRASPETETETETEKNTKAVTSKADADNGPGSAQHLQAQDAASLKEHLMSKCAECGDVGWYVGHEDQCYEDGDCGCGGVQIQCECAWADLRKYGAHLEGCAALWSVRRTVDPVPVCDCGFDAAPEGTSG